MAEGRGRRLDETMMTRIAPFALAAIAASILISSPPALAQPYGWGPPRYEEGWGPRRPPPPPPPPPPPGPPGWGRGGWDRGWGPPPPRGGERFGSVCVTSRGNCNAGFRAPRNTPCRCFIPGFGEKRGAIGF